MNETKLHDLVALLEDAEGVYLGSGKPTLVQRGQVGTVVEFYHGGELEIEVTDANSKDSIMLSVAPEKTMVIRFERKSQTV
jgi:hypothetical protein